MSSSSARKKASNDGVGVDRISNLPDAIRIRILSLLPTHVAVTTSVLSTKWEFLWKNIYNLTFDDLHWRSRNGSRKDSSTSFALFVNKVLKSLNEQSIQHFYLRIHKNYKQYDVSSWISAAISKNVKVIEFFEEHYDDIEMPNSLYTCKTLEVLRLRTYNLILPSLISLPNLKTLSLEISIKDSISKLVSGCLSLENLDISTLSVNVPTLTILSPTLRNLSLEFFDRCYSSEYEDDNMNEDTKLVIDTPQLRYLNLDRVETCHYSVEKLCFLEEAHINIFFDEIHEPLIYNKYFKGVPKLFQRLYNVKTLSLKTYAFWGLSFGGVIPRFSRLSKLSVEVTVQLRLLLNLLENCNELQSLTISLVGHYCKEVTCWSEPEKVPICFLSSLHTISIHAIKDHGFEMIAYMLQNAKVLSTMKLQAFDFNANEKLLQKIPNIPQGSENCQVIYLNPMK